jgi:hypothetical protein
MEETCESLLNQYSSFDGSIANLYALDVYANQLEERANLLYKENAYGEAEATKTERVSVLAKKDASKSFYLLAKSVQAYAEQQAQDFLKNLLFKKYGDYQLLHE